MARQIIAVGMARTGTMHIATLFRKLFKANEIAGIAVHQGGAQVEDNFNYFNSNWALSKQMMQIARKDPHIRFIVLLRDPITCVSSLMNLYKKKGNPLADKPVEHFVDQWVQCYRHISMQVQAMNPKPFVMRTEDYFAGEHTDLLLDLFDFPKSEENYQLVQEHLKKKVNHYGDPEQIEIGEPTYGNCLNMGRTIEKLCKNSWVDQEVYGDSDLTSVNLNYPRMDNMYQQKMFGAEMGQTFTSLFVFEWLLNLYPVDHIIELGTGRGGLSMFLATQAEIRGMGFITFDALKRMNDEINYITYNPPTDIEKRINFFKKDVFTQEVMDRVVEIIKDNRVLIYCDNGNKPREIARFAPLIKKGDIIGCHDWHPAQFINIGVEEIQKEHSLKVIFEDFADEYTTRQRFWYKWK